MVEPQSSKLMTRVRFPSSALRSPRQRIGGLLAGRSVVASAPALGAGDRRFESCRPDSHSPHSPTCTHHRTIEEKPVKSAVETLSPTRAKITVEVPFEELKPSLDAAYQAIAKQINIPGFRKGKVPPPVIDRQVGRGAVLDEAINDALPKLYVQALQENDLQPLAQPEIDVTKLEDNSLFEFTAEVDVRPSIEVPSYDALSVQVDDVDRLRRGRRRAGRGAA